MKAETQYDDLKGTVAATTPSGTNLMDVVNSSDIPAGYWPIGLQFTSCGEEEGGLDGSRLSVTALCVNAEVAGVESEVASYVADHGKLVVYKFETTTTLRKLLGHIKELDIVLFKRDLADVPTEPGTH